jgi:ABC-type iron transport system FetAB permease component
MRLPGNRNAVLRPQDVLFGLLGLSVVALLAFQLGIIVLVLVGAFICGSIYVFAGMIPSRDEAFWRRTFTSVFLSLVVASLVLILPGTMGLQARHPGVEKSVVAIAGLLPLIAFCFEVIRTPRVLRGILRCLGYR